METDVFIDDSDFENSDKSQCGCLGMVYYSAFFKLLFIPHVFM